ncbi:MAG: hypothetical protein JXR65_06730 [Bacteroidales bacterium]|nr:hypothetical protein [Bacteroidales bacterium]
MNRLLIFTVLVLGFGQLKSQTIEIGQDAKDVKQLIEWSTRQRTGYDTYGNSKGNNVTWDVNYYNGQITEVIQCWANQYLIDFRMSANFCKYYMMEYGKLAYVLTQYEDVSLEKLETSYDNSYGNMKIGEYYFSDDYKNYSKLYLAKNGYATVEWRETDTDLLPSNIKNSIQAKINQKEEEENKKELARQKEKELQKEIKSKTYDLKENNISLYNETFSEIKSDIADYFQKSSSYYRSSSIPSFTDLANGNEKKYRFTNTYTAYYKLEDHSRESVDYGYYIEAGSYDVRQTKEIKLISGTDYSCSLFNSISVKIPTIKIQGYEVMTEATFPNIKVDYAKGITIVKIKSGEVEFKSFPPDEDIQIKLKEKLKSEPKGKYIVQYEVGNIAGKEFVNTELEKKTTKVGSGWLLLGLLLLGLLL